MGSRWSGKAVQVPGVIEDMSWAHRRTIVSHLEVFQDMWMNSTEADVAEGSRRKENRGK